MDSSTKRKVGAIALIGAGIAAFLVPFLLHGPALQASNNGGGNSNNNNGGGTNTCTTNCNPCTTNCSTCTTNCNTCTTNCSTDTGGGGTQPCSADPDNNAGSHDNEGKHLAKGSDKQDKQDMASSIVSKADHFMAALHKHNPQHDATHSTKTDNDTIGSHAGHSNGHDTDDGACADSEGNESSDDQGNDD